MMGENKRDAISASDDASRLVVCEMEKANTNKALKVDDTIAVKTVSTIIQASNPKSHANTNTVSKKQSIAEKLRALKERIKLEVENTTKTETEKASITTNITIEKIEASHREFGIAPGAKIYVKWDVVYDGEDMPPADDPTIELPSDSEELVDGCTVDGTDNNTSITDTNIENSKFRVKWFSGTLGEKLGLDTSSINGRDICSININNTENHGDNNKDNGRVNYYLHYDADPQFEACTRIVGFNVDGTLYDTEDEAYLEWLTEEDYINNGVNMGYELHVQMDEDDTCSANDLIEAMDKVDEQHGSLLNASMNAFKTQLSHEKQVQMSLEYRKFADMFKEKLKEKMLNKLNKISNSDDKNIISNHNNMKSSMTIKAEDIQSILAELKDESSDIQ